MSMAGVAIGLRSVIRNGEAMAGIIILPRQRWNTAVTILKKEEIT
jgi:hypothetical protein